MSGGKKESYWQKKRPEHTGSCTPHSGAEIFILKVRSQSGKGFMQGRDMIQKQHCGGWSDVSVLMRVPWWLKCQVIVIHLVRQ